MRRTASALFYVVLVEGTRAFSGAFSSREHADKFAENRSEGGQAHIVEEAIVDSIDPFGERPLMIPTQPPAEYVPHVLPENPTIELVTADPPVAPASEGCDPTSGCC